MYVRVEGGDLEIIVKITEPKKTLESFQSFIHICLKYTHSF